MINVRASDLTDLWDQVNQKLIFDDECIDFARPGVSVHSYHNIMIAETADYKLSLTDLGYTKTKWSMLLRLYFDPDEYRMLYNRLKFYKDGKRGQAYIPDIGMQFKSRQNRTGACLMGMTLRYSKKTGWECSIFSRTNETTARWSVDLLFLNRLLKMIGEDLDLFEPKDVRVHWMAGSVFQSVVTAPLYMGIIGRDEQMKKMARKYLKGKEMTRWQKAVAKRYGDSYNEDYGVTGALKYQNYKSQVRATKAYLYHKGLEELKEISNDELKFPEVDLELEEDFFDRKGFR